MNGSVGDILSNGLTYINLLFASEFVQWFLAAFFILACLGILKKLFKINS